MKKILLISLLSLASASAFGQNTTAVSDPGADRLLEVNAIRSELREDKINLANIRLLDKDVTNLEEKKHLEKSIATIERRTQELKARLAKIEKPKAQKISAAETLSLTLGEMMGDLNQAAHGSPQEKLQICLKYYRSTHPQLSDDDQEEKGHEQCLGTPEAGTGVSDRNQGNEAPLPSGKVEIGTALRMTGPADKVSVEEFQATPAVQQ
jgi:Trp operon repressor